VALARSYDPRDRMATQVGGEVDLGGQPAVRASQRFAIMVGVEFVYLAKPPVWGRTAGVHGASGVLMCP
jgi:hypothetical protein